MERRRGEGLWRATRTSRSTTTWPAPGRSPRAGRYVTEPLAGAQEAAFERSFASSEQVQREAVAICEAVQVGLRSATYRHGRYSVLRENGVHHFHGLLSRFLS